MIDWQYVAGYFDADGSVSLHVERKKGKAYTVRPIISFVGAHATIEVIRQFLRDNGIARGSHYIIKSKYNHWGSTSHLAITDWKTTTQFANMLLPFAIEKHRALEIALETIHLRRSIIESGANVQDSVHQFAALREESHKLAKKGPKHLKPL